MPVSSTSRKAGPFLGNGVSTSFPFTFKVFAAADLAVYHTDADGVQTLLATGYTVAINADQETSPGGSVTYPSAGSPMAADESLDVIGAQAYLQGADIRNGGTFQPSVIQRALDYLAILAQQLLEKVNRALAYRPGDSGSTTLPSAADRAGKVFTWDDDANPAVSVDNFATLAAAAAGSASAAAASASASANSEREAAAIVLGNFLQDGLGAQERTFPEKVREADVTPFDFMTVAQIADVQGNVGSLDVTTPLLNFFTHCIATGKRGKIRAGTYKVTRSVLAFDNGHLDTPWPEIDTEGHLAVIFTTSDTTTAPILSITNGTAASAAGKFWRGGKLGGINFKDTSGGVATDRHGLVLRGIWGMDLGWMRGDNLPGDTVNIEAKLFGGTNPDPYMVAFCRFAGVEGNSNKGWALRNENLLGFTFNYVQSLRVIGTGLGGWFGFGTGNYLDGASIASINGWAFDCGTAAVTGVTLGRLRVRSLELDNVENGVRCNHVRQFSFDAMRVIHRYQTAPNVSANYFPRVAIKLCDGSSPAVSEGSMAIQHRIEAGGLKADLGAFLDASSSTGIANLTVDQRVIDNAGFGFVDTDIYTNLNVNTKDVTLKRDGKLILDQTVKAFAVVTATTAQTVPNTGFSGAGAKITFPNLRAGTDRDGNYSTVNSEYTVPYSGTYRVSGVVHFAAAAGTRVRFGFWRDRAGSLAAVAIATRYAVTANAEGYVITGAIDLVKGDVVAFYADQNTAGAVNLTASFSTTAENQWSIEAL